MTDAELIETVRQMRAAQKSYFKTRGSFYLDESKRLERRIDEELAARAAGQSKLL
jgi:hypothetical protein